MANRARFRYRIYLREWRQKRGLSQEGLARRIGVSIAQVSRYETGDSTIALETQLKLMAALDINPAQLFSDPAAPSADALLSDASEETRARTLALIRAMVEHDRD